jgi:pimeloyl-ACP methyl ester carboxylesterase
MNETITTKDGAALHFEQRGDGTPLFFLHVFGGTSQDFAHVFDVEALSRSFHVISPDARGRVE